ncbi:J domain-containing protein [Enterovirga rhinocerotis]|uniref:J domain-containing protein n=1 Tax=Enterovirga rhinocerotis TaxID=1339210 RepID=A0A4R7CAV6_9HYPH|nr:J domain-containing protein [Enterovirga rhinocerotis]TDR94166.1 hypothetical protein EV668_1443 [Enterovirga rhinocerotis]
MTTGYPLAWPQGWPRTLASDRIDGRHRFKRSDRKLWTFAAARNALMEEASRLGSRSWETVLSTNFRLTAGGDPTAAKGRPIDEGVALYMRRNGRPYVMACDRYVRAEENMRSLTLAIAAMRQLERHGGGIMMERAFAGFAALPPPGGRPWHEVLGVSPAASLHEVEAVFRRLAAIHHPDVGGSAGAMAELNAARAQAQKERS